MIRAKVLLFASIAAVVHSSNETTVVTSSLIPDEFEPVLDWATDFDPTGLSALLLSYLNKKTPSPEAPTCIPKWGFEISNDHHDKYSFSIALNSARFTNAMSQSIYKSGFQVYHIPGKWLEPTSYFFGITSGNACIRHFRVFTRDDTGMTKAKTSYASIPAEAVATCLKANGFLKDEYFDRSSGCLFMGEDHDIRTIEVRLPTTYDLLTQLEAMQDASATEKISSLQEACRYIVPRSTWGIPDYSSSFCEADQDDDNGGASQYNIMILLYLQVLMALVILL